MKITAVVAVILAVLSSVSATTTYGVCGDKCGGYEPECGRNLECKDGTCQRLNIGLGRHCGGCRSCKSWLVCEHESCAYPPVPCGGRCNSRKKCDDGLHCDDGKCVETVGRGHTCGGCKVCDDGLQCHSHIHKCYRSY